MVHVPGLAIVPSITYFKYTSKRCSFGSYGKDISLDLYYLDSVDHDSFVMCASAASKSSAPFGADIVTPLTRLFSLVLS